MALILAAGPTSARDCLDYATYGGPHGEPPLAGGLLLPTPAVDLSIQAGHAYLACGDGGLWIAELSEPTSPVLVGGLDLLGDAATVAAWGDWALVGVGSVLKVIDITSANDPQWLQSLNVGGRLRDVVMAGSLALAAADSAGLITVDCSVAFPFGSIGAVTTSAPAWSAAASADGATAWVATDAGVEIVALDGAAPMLVGTLVTGRAMRRVVRDGDLLWAAADDGLLLACNLTDPRAPREIRRHTIAAPVLDMNIASGFATLVCADGRVRIAGVDRRGVLVPMGTLTTPGETQAVAAFGPYLAFADGPGGIQIAWHQCDLVLDAGIGIEPRARLMGVVPNPLNPGTTVIFALAAAADVRITLHDARGRTVADLLDEHRSAGTQQVKWDGRLADGGRAPSGVWYVRMEAGGRVVTSALTLLR